MLLNKYFWFHSQAKDGIALPYLPGVRRSHVSGQCEWERAFVGPLPLAITQAQVEGPSELSANPPRTWTREKEAPVALPAGGERQTTGCYLYLPNQPKPKHLGEQKMKPRVDEATEVQRKKAQTLVFPGVSLGNSPVTQAWFSYH